MSGSDRNCPHCGAPVMTKIGRLDFSTGVFEFEKHYVQVNRREMLLLDALMKAYPSGLHRQRLEFAAYDVRDDVDVKVGVESHLSKLRRKLREAGIPISIETKRYLGTRLVVAA